MSFGSVHIRSILLNQDIFMKFHSGLVELTICLLSPLSVALSL